MIDLNYLRKLLKIFDESTAVELKIEEEGVSLRIAKQSNGGTVLHSAPQAPMFQMQPTLQTPPPQITAPASAEPQEEQVKAASDVRSEHLHQITSPIVGTFYRAPSPDAEPFAQVGARVSPGSTLCIIEAMKLMNEIESDIAGTVVKVLVENAQPVEYGQPLFLIQLD
jgi:acetyl-CoA carboxylase biotin carboxyl carrier protein